MKPATSFLPLKPKVFHILLALDGGAQHGYGIKISIKSRTDGVLDLDPGGLYRLIGRLEDMGLLSMVDTPPAAEEKEDSRRRYYALTDLGREVVGLEARRLTELVASADVAALASSGR